jgi:hypothetical protein
MKKSITRVLFGFVVIGTMLMVGPITKSKPAVVLAETDGCRLTTLSGGYGFSFNGYFNTGTPVAFTPLAAAGTITFRPDGTLKRDFSGSFGGGLFTVKDSGTYSLNQDCTFTANLPMAGETWNLIPVELGLQIEFFVNTPGRVGAGTLTRQ